MTSAFLQSITKKIILICLIVLLQVKQKYWAAENMNVRDHLFIQEILILLRANHTTQRHLFFVDLEIHAAHTQVVKHPTKY